jgi:hypothetical protein
MLRSYCLKVSCRKCFFCGLMALGLLVGLAGGAKAQPTYSFTTIDVPGASVGTGRIYAYGINDSGQIVGSCFGGGDNFSQDGVLVDQGNYTKLDPPGSSGTYAQGINAFRPNRGMVQRYCPAI